MEADIIKSKLESFQIPVLLQYEAAGRIFGITMDGLGKVKVMVPEIFPGRSQENIGRLIHSILAGPCPGEKLPGGFRPGPAGQRLNCLNASARRPWSAGEFRSYLMTLREI